MPYPIAPVDRVILLRDAAIGQHYRLVRSYDGIGYTATTAAFRLIGPCKLPGKDGCFDCEVAGVPMFHWHGLQHCILAADVIQQPGQMPS